MKRRSAWVAFLNPLQSVRLHWPYGQRWPELRARTLTAFLRGNDTLIGGNNNGQASSQAAAGSRLRASETMSILKLLGKHTFDVDTTIILASAFDAAWLSLQTSGSPFAADDRASQTRDLLAQRIIEIAQRGERDKRRLVEEALARFVTST